MNAVARNLLLIGGGIAAAEIAINRTTAITEKALTENMLSDQNQVVAQGDGFIIERKKPDLTGPTTTALTAAGVVASVAGIWLLSRGGATGPASWLAQPAKIAIPGVALVGIGSGVVAGARTVAAKLEGARVTRLGDD